MIEFRWIWNAVSKFVFDYYMERKICFTKKRNGRNWAWYYWCVFFSEINFIKPDLKNRLTEECSATCTLLKVTSCKPNMNELASNVQQKSHHTTLYTNHTYLLLSSSHKLVYRVY